MLNIYIFLRLTEFIKKLFNLIIIEEKNFIGFIIYYLIFLLVLINQ